MAKKPPKGKARINILMDEKLRNFMKKYAAERKTTITHIVYQTFLRIQNGELGVETLDDDLLEWAKEYARANHTTVPELVNRLLIELRKKESGIGVKQI